MQVQNGGRNQRKFIRNTCARLEPRPGSCLKNKAPVDQALGAQARMLSADTPSSFVSPSLNDIILKSPRHPFSFIAAASPSAPPPSLLPMHSSSNPFI